jgi:Tfp pilus assembly protein PilE
MRTTHKGFTLLIAVVLSTVSLSVALALINVSYKQIVLALTARSSQYAFYNADATIECALYYDQKENSFDFTSPDASITCEGQTLNFSTSPNSSVVAGGIRTTTLTLPCAGGGEKGSIVVYKYSSGVPSTKIYVSGYSTCSATDNRRVERGLSVSY